MEKKEDILMKFINNNHKLREIIFFSEKDLKELWFSKEDIDLLVSEKILNIYEIKDKCIYSLWEQDFAMTSDYLIILAELLNNDSYLTATSALSMYGITYWWVETMHFSADKKEKINIGKTNLFFLKSGIVNEYSFEEDFYTISPWIVGNISVLKKYKLATPEQALVDFFLNERFIYSEEELKDLFCKFELKEKVNLDRLNYIVELNINSNLDFNEVFSKNIEELKKIITNIK